MKTEKSRAERLADWAESHRTMGYADIAAELRRLHSLNQELLESLQRIAITAGATVCNVEWVEKHARAAIAKAQEHK